MLSLALSLLLSAAPSIWGSSPEYVEKALTNLHFDEEKVGRDTAFSSRTFDGTFYGRGVTGRVVFLNEKLISMEVNLSRRDDRPASRRWVDLIRDLSKDFGKPGSLHTWPENSVFADMWSAIDHRIMQGDWEPVASWTRTDPEHPTVTVDIMVGEPDRFGSRDLWPRVLMFTDAAEKLTKK